MKKQTEKATAHWQKHRLSVFQKVSKAQSGNTDVDWSPSSSREALTITITLIWALLQKQWSKVVANCQKQVQKKEKKLSNEKLNKIKEI